MIVAEKTWKDAENDCVKSGAHLASIHSVEENDFINKLHDLTGVSTWIGGIRDGRSFKWSDGSVFCYQNWRREGPNWQEPNNLREKEDCMELYSSRITLWKCDFTALAFICKKRK